MPSISDIISIAKISQYLCSNVIEKSGLYGGGVNNRLPQLLCCVRRNVEWAYGNDNDYEDIQAMANYLYALCAPFNAEAIVILNSGNGGNVISPINPTLGVYLIPITSADFTDDTNYDNPLIVGKRLAIFWNDIPRYLNDDEYEMTATGFNILIDGFDAQNNDYTLYIYII